MQRYLQPKELSKVEELQTDDDSVTPAQTWRNVLFSSNIKILLIGVGLAIAQQITGVNEYVLRYLNVRKNWVNTKFVTLWKHHHWISICVDVGISVNCWTLQRHLLLAGLVVVR